MTFNKMTHFYWCPVVSHRSPFLQFLEPLSAASGSPGGDHGARSRDPHRCCSCFTDSRSLMTTAMNRLTTTNTATNTKLLKSIHATGTRRRRAPGFRPNLPASDLEERQQSRPSEPQCAESASRKKWKPSTAYT